MRAMQLLWLAIGFSIAAFGGALKAVEVVGSQGVFEYVFFSGLNYIMMVVGLGILIVALGFDIIFGPDEAEEGDA